MLPKQYAWLADEPGPRILKTALSLYGTMEKPGPGNNPAIMAWAKRCGLDKVYREDKTAWCGLFMAYVALESGWEPPMNPLWARNWLNFGTREPIAMLGDVLVFSRGSGGHVGLCIAFDTDCYHVLGGNQSDAVNIKRIARSRFLRARRCPWRIAQPVSVRVVKMAATGPVSVNEG